MSAPEDHRSDLSAGPQRRALLEGLDRYEIFELCCEANSTAIYCGRLRENGLSVLIKTFKIGPPDVDIQLLRRDYELTQALRTACAAKILGVEPARAEPALIYVDEGARPLEIILSDEPLETESALSIGAALVGAVAELHSEPIVHGNLNSSTIWFCRDSGAVRISGFGGARTPADATEEERLDATRDVRYLAPEQSGRVRQRVDERADIYSIGIVLFRLLTGKVPFDGTDPLRIVDAHLTIAPAFPFGLAASIPRTVAKLILKCLAKSVDERYFSVGGLKADLFECLSQWRAKGSIADFELGRCDAAGMLRIPTKLYGREHETALLRDFVRKARGGRPAVLLVSGLPGVGKSTFLNQLSGFVRKENGRFIVGKFDQYKRNIPYFSLIQAFRQLIHQLLTEPADRLNAWKSAIIVASENAAQIVIDVVPELELVTGPQPPVPSLGPTETRNRFNRIFTNVILAFAQPDSPLYVFMDDLQWSDPASVELLSHVLAHQDTRNLFFVGAYRSNEVGDEHHMETAMRTLSSCGVDLQRISLDDLRLADVVPLVQATLSPAAQDALPLASVLHSRSRGNPLYLTQLLHFLHEAGLIAFDYREGLWRWTMARIQAEAITQDVLELLSMRISALPHESREVLSIGACLGGMFTAERLIIAADQCDADSHLAAAVRADLLVTVDDAVPGAPAGNNSPRGIRQYRFLHDRIQQAAFDLIPEGRRPPLRLQIGRRLMARLTLEERSVPQLDVLANLNDASLLITSRQEQQVVAQLNLVAGQKARDVLAYRDALRYMQAGIKLLDADSWNTSYQLAFDLHASAFECEYLTGGFERANELFSLLVERSRSQLDTAKVFLTNILLSTSDERYADAVQIGVIALRSFGINYMRNPKLRHLLKELAVASVRMRGRKPTDLLEARMLTDACKLAALKILVALFPTAYFLSPNLLMFTGLKVVNYSLRHGISPLAANGFVLYGLGLGAALDKQRAGYEFGKFAVELAEKGGDPTVLCKVLVIFSEFIKFWIDPIDDSFPLIERARRLALQVGDHQYVNYAIIGGISLKFSRGTKLAEFLEHCDEHEAFILHSRDVFPIESHRMWKNCALALSGATSPKHSLNNDAYDEKAAEDRYRKTGNLTLLSYQLTLRLQLLCIFGLYDEAFALSEHGEAVIDSAPGYITVAEHYFYRGLAATSLLALRPRERRLRKVAHRCLKRLDLFASNGPANFGSRATLLRARLAGAAGDVANALRLYSRAVEMAEHANSWQLIGLANEGAGTLCQTDGHQRLAVWYFEAARAAYAKWGARAKVSALDNAYGHLFSGTVPEDGRNSGGRSDRPGSFDAETAAAVFQAAAVGKQDRVLAKLVQIARIQAGAERAFLLVSRGAAWQVEASDVPQGDDWGAADAASRVAFSWSLINYVSHTRQDLFINDAHLDRRFQDCPYLQKARPKSVICATISKGSELIGTIYLENRSLPHALDARGVAWIQMLAAEIGLVIWGDKLSRYRDYLHRFAPASAAKEIDADPLSPDLVAQTKDISVLFADLAGYTRMSEQMEQQRFDEFINRVLSEFIDEVHRFNGTLLRIRGDELFCIFEDADPTRHANNATHAALSITRVVSRLNEHRSLEEPAIVVNMGIHSGTAAVGLQPIEAAGGPNWRYDATGMAVNIAARAREYARDGKTIVSAAVAERLEKGFDLEDLGYQPMKNLTLPVHLYSVVDPTVPSERTAG